MMRGFCHFVGCWILRMGTIGLIAAPLWSTSAQSLDALANRQQAKLQDAIRRLSEQREAVQAAQVPLADEWNNLQQEVKTLRTTARELQTVRDSRSISLEAMESQVEERQQEYDYIARVLSGEFIAGYETSLSIGELSLQRKSIQDLNLFLENEEATDQKKMERTLSLLRTAAERLESLIGGKRYSGQVLSREDQLVNGKFVQVGPLLYFSDESGETVGWVDESRSLQPQIRPLEKSQGQRISEIVQSGKGNLPVDPTVGDAIKMRETKESLMEHLDKGGFWVYPIVFFALISSLVAAYKGIQIFSIRQPQHWVVGKIVKLLRDGKKTEALDLAQKQPQPAASLLSAGVEHSHEPVELVEEVMYESMLDVQPRLERFLNLIAVTAATAPLLGLLGTVTGIIKTFKLMQAFGAGDPKPLISGISEALITTELGLVLAIPALIVHALLSRKAAGVLARLERFALEFVNGLSRGQSESAKSPNQGGSRG